MAKRKQDEILGDDGNALPPPEPGSDLASAIYLLEYGRKRGFRIGPQIQVGGIILQVRDIRQEAQLGAAQHDAASDLDPESDMAVILKGD